MPRKDKTQDQKTTHKKTGKKGGTSKRNIPVDEINITYIEEDIPMSTTEYED